MARCTMEWWSASLVTNVSPSPAIGGPGPRVAAVVVRVIEPAPHAHEREAVAEAVMPERKPIVDENRMPPGKTIAVDERGAADTPVREADAAEAAAREAGMGKAAARKATAHSTEAVSTKTVAAETMPTKAPMATTAAVSPSR